MDKPVDKSYGCGNPETKRPKRGDCGQNVEGFPQILGYLSTALVAGIFDSLNDFRHLVVDVASFPHLLADLLGCIHNCCVVAVTEIHADFRQRQIC